MTKSFIFDIFLNNFGHLSARWYGILLNQHLNHQNQHQKQHQHHHHNQHNRHRHRQHHHHQWMGRWTERRILTYYRASITVRLTSCLDGLDSNKPVNLLLFNRSKRAVSKQVQQEVSCTVILHSEHKNWAFFSIRVSNYLASEMWSLFWRRLAELADKWTEIISWGRKHKSQSRYIILKILNPFHQF